MGKDLRGKELGKNISQEKTGYYVARFVDKSGKRQSKRFKKLHECRQWLAETLFYNEQHDLSHPLDLSVDAWYEQWLDIKKNSIRESTLTWYKSSYQHHIKPYIGDLPINKVKPMHCQKIFSVLSDDGMSVGTIQCVRIVLSNLFEIALQNDVIPSNPCKKVTTKNLGRQTVPKNCLNLDTQKRFLQIIQGNKHELVFRFILQTGLRIGELIGLKWSDIDFEKNCINVCRTMYQYNKIWYSTEPKTSSGKRVIPLTKEGRKILEAQKEVLKKIKVIPIEFRDFVFLNSKGKPRPRNAYDKVITRICKQNNLRHFSSHTLRHTFATRCLEAGMKPKTLQVILGHSNIALTMNTYVHITEDEKKKEVQLFENFFERMVQ